MKIYCLHDDNEVRYIGKTIHTLEKRFAGHRKSAKSKKSHLYNWWRSLENEPKIELIEIVNLSEKLDEREKFWIAYFRAHGNKLTNLTDGGDGALGRKNSPETLAKISSGVKEWAASDAAREFYAKRRAKSQRRQRAKREKQDGRKTSWKTRKPRQVTCTNCDTVFLSIGQRAKFCNPSCKREHYKNLAPLV